MTSLFKKFPFFPKKIDLFGFVAFIAAATAATFGFPNTAMAQPMTGGATLGDMMCTVVSNLMPNATGAGGHGLGDLINGIAYIGGAATVGSGLLHLVRWSDSSRDTPLHQPIWRMIGGACLLSFPSVINMILNTLFLNNGPGGIASIVPCTGDIGGMNPVQIVNGQGSLDVLMTNLIGSIKDPMTMMLSIISIMVGLVFVFRGLVKASRYGTDPRSASPTNIIANLAAGAILVSVGSSLDMIFASLFGYGGIGYSTAFWTTFNNGTWVQEMAFTPAELQQFEATVTAALTFFQLVGMIAFIRGWMILKAYAEGSGQSTAAAGLTHIIGGALAINIYQILSIIDYTFGTGFLT